MNRYKDNITPYLGIRDRLTTFTIINCEHKDFPWRWIGHTAVVYRCHETGQLMVFESTTLNKFTGKSGVQLTPMGLWLSKYPGKVFVRIATFKSSKTIEFMAERFIKNHLGSSYPNLKTWSGKMKLVLAKLDLKIRGKDLLKYDGEDKGIFCTMLVIMFLQYCELMTDDTLAQEWEPDDTRIDLSMTPWLINCEYGEEIQIK